MTLFFREICGISDLFCLTSRLHWHAGALTPFDPPSGHYSLSLPDSSSVFPPCRRHPHPGSTHVIRRILLLLGLAEIPFLCVLGRWRGQIWGHFRFQIKSADVSANLIDALGKWCSKTKENRLPLSWMTDQRWKPDLSEVELDLRRTIQAKTQQWHQAGFTSAHFFSS